MCKEALPVGKAAAALSGAVTAAVPRQPLQARATASCCFHAPLPHRPHSSEPPAARCCRRRLRRRRAPELAAVDDEGPGAHRKHIDPAQQQRAQHKQRGGVHQEAERDAAGQHHDVVGAEVGRVLAQPRGRLCAEALTRLERFEGPALGQERGFAAAARGAAPAWGGPGRSAAALVHCRVSCQQVRGRRQVSRLPCCRCRCPLLQLLVAHL